MSVGPNKCVGYRFDRFEVHLGEETLTCNGHSVRIQQIPFQTLVVLLENAGRIVPRNELQQRLWNDQTFIEVDNSLRVAVTKLREALGEQATDPRFIRTVARKGYQFIGEVIAIHAPADQYPPTSLSDREGVRSEALGEPVRLRVPWRFAGVAAAVLAVICAAAAGLFWYRQRPLASDKDTVALGGVTNESGDSAFDGILTTVFRLKLQESPYLSALSEQDFRRRSGGNDESASLSLQISACRALGGSFLVDGRLLNRKPGYEIDLDVVRCADGDRLDTVRAVANAQSDVMPTLNLAVEKMRRRLGESEESLEKYNVPLTQATTGSLLALKAFMQGTQLQSNGQDTQSISSYKLAIDLDPEFAMAYARLGTAYLNTRQYTAARTAYETAFKLRDRTTDRQRLAIAAHYYSTVTGELPRAIEGYELWRMVYPRDVVPVDNLAGTYLTLGAVDNAMQMAKLAVELAPNTPAPYALLARADLGTGHYAELNALCHDPQRTKSDLVLFHSACYLSAFVQHDDETAQRELQWARGNPQECVLLEYEAWTEIYQGKLARGRATFAQARESALKQNLMDFVAELDLDEAGLDADIGDAKEARARALDAIELAPESRFVQAFSALALARAGERGLAKAQAAKAAAQTPLDTEQRDTLLGETRACLQMQQGNLAAAIQTMEAVRPFDSVSYMALSPAYYRGLALAQDGQYDAAAREFRYVIDHHILYPQSIYSLLSQLQLARALQLSGHVEQARAQYQAVSNNWSSADADFPPLRQLRRWFR